MLNLPKSLGVVHYRLAVVDSLTGREVKRLPRKRNLLTDSGLEFLVTTGWAGCFSCAVVGTGTDPVKRASGAVTVTRAANVLTASANFFEAGDVGRLWKFDSGVETYITVFTDPQHVTVADAGAVGASPGTVWYVNRTGLQAEAKRSNLYGNTGGDNGKSLAVHTWTFKRTFIFSAEAGPVVYNEIGWSPTLAAGNNLFGQDIITGGIALVAGQQLKVVVELSVTFSPAVSTAYVNVITNWAQNGNCIVENWGSISGVDPDGATSGGGILDPGFLTTIGINDSADALVMDGSGKDMAINSSVAAGFLSYVAGSRVLVCSGTFSVLQGNGNVRSLWLAGAGGTRDCCFRVLLDANEIKDGDHTLNVQFSRSWGRILVN